MGALPNTMLCYMCFMSIHGPCGHIVFGVKVWFLAPSVAPVLRYSSTSIPKQGEKNIAKCIRTNKNQIVKV